MKKNLLILIFAIIIIAVIAGLLYVFISKKPIKIFNIPGVNINEEAVMPPKISGINGQIFKYSIDEEVPLSISGSAYSFLSFCE